MINSRMRYLSYLNLSLLCILFLAGCAFSPSTPDVVLECPDPVVEIVTEPGLLEAGGTIELEARATGGNLAYEWEDGGIGGAFTRVNDKKTTYNIPNYNGQISITVKVANGCGQHTDSLVLQIDATKANLATPTSSASETSSQISTPILSPTPINSSSPTNTATNTPVSTETLPPTTTATQTSTATPSGSAAQHVLLLEPKHDTCVGDRVIFQWQYRPLNDIEGPGGEYFALNLWDGDGVRRSVSWIKEPRYEIDNFYGPVAVYADLVNCNQDAGCKWSVDVIIADVEKGQGYLPNSFRVLALSNEVRDICVSAAPPPIPPTDTPGGQPPKPEPTRTPPPP